MSEPLLKAHYAYARGVDPAAITLAVRRGLIKLLPDGKVDPDQADAVWYRRHLQRQDHTRSGAADEARREEALTRSTGAKIIMTRRKAEQLRDAMVTRDTHQAEIGAATVALREELARATGLKSRRIVEAIAKDLGDLQAEALRVTQ